MLSRIPGATLFFAQSSMQSFKGIKGIAFFPTTRTIARGFLATAHRTLLILGISAMAALCVMFFKPNLADKLKALSPFAETLKPEPVVPVAPPLTNLLSTPTKPEPTSSMTLNDEQEKAFGTPRQQQWVTNWLSKRYHVAGDATNMLVSATYLTARETKLDPLLILAVMSIESGLNPFAESAMGAQGLMQVMSKVHHEKFEELGGLRAALNPVANIKVGSLILKDYVTRGGSIEAGLKLYVGAAAFDNDAGYGSKVLAEYHRLKDVATGKNVPTSSAPVIVPLLKPHPQIDMTESEPATHAEPDSAALEGKQMPSKTDQFATL
jgi:hypothetical protein